MATTTEPSGLETARVVLTNRELQKKHPDIILMFFGALACLAFGLSLIIGGIVCMTNRQEVVYNMGFSFIILGVVCMGGLSVLCFFLWLKKDLMKEEVPRFTRSVGASIRRSFRQARSSMRRRPNPTLASPPPQQQQMNNQPETSPHQQPPLPTSAPPDNAGISPPWTITRSVDRRPAGHRPRQGHIGIDNDNFEPAVVVSQRPPSYDTAMNHTPSTHQTQFNRRQQPMHRRPVPHPMQQDIQMMQQPHVYGVINTDRRRMAPHQPRAAPVPPGGDAGPINVMLQDQIWTTHQSTGV